MITIANRHTQACFDAWTNCEDLLVTITRFKSSFSKQLLQVVDECAAICMGTFHAIKGSPQNIRRMALLCVGICEECAELCENHDGEKFRQCAAICRQCSETLLPIAFES